MSDTIIGANAEKPKGPTVAVALEYDPTNSSAPTIVASGKGAIAEQILNIAFANGIKVREDAELVQVLSMLDVDSVIPVEAFAAVAEILAYVYRENGLARQRLNNSSNGNI